MNTISVNYTLKFELGFANGQSAENVLIPKLVERLNKYIITIP